MISRIARDVFLRQLPDSLTWPDAQGYDQIRGGGNPAVDRAPEVIVIPRDRREVALAIEVAAEAGLPVAVRGGGQHVGGWGSADGGVVIDLRQFRTCFVNADTRRVRVGAGWRWADLDRELWRHRLVLPGGHGPQVGVAGYTLGGGIGELSRSIGLSCDTVIGFEVVTADGRARTISAVTEPELFWALRGGGGGYAAVTEFEFAATPAVDFVAGPLFCHVREAVSAIEEVADWLAAAPHCASVTMIAWTTPPLPYVPHELWFEPSVLVLPSWSGDPGRGVAELERLARRLPGFLSADLKPLDYPDYSRFFAPGPTAPELAEYARGEFLTSLDPAVLAAALDATFGAGPAASLVFGAMGGRIAEVARDETAFAHRDAAWFAEVNARWSPGTDSTSARTRARHVVDVLAPVSVGSYLNLLVESDEASRSRALGHNADRLARIKQAVDPSNVFVRNGSRD